MPRQHLARRDIQALLDAELRGWRLLRARRHLAVCPACRDAVAVTRNDTALCTALLDAMPRPVDLDESWARFAVRSGGQALEGARPRQARWYLAGVGSGIAAVVALLLLAKAPAPASRHLDLVPAEKAPTADDRRFVSRLHGLLAQGDAYLIEDRCCDDRDGEGPADDGAVLIRMRESPTPVVVMYEDRDGSGSLTPGDIVRLVSRGAAPPATPGRQGQS